MNSESATASPAATAGTPHIRILVFQGSPRREDNCPNQAGKTQLLADYIKAHAPANVEIELCDLSVGNGPRIQPCKGCVSTAGGFHCHWPCDCYSKNSDKMPDFLHDNDVYQRLESSDGFMVLTPIHWYGPSTAVKALFDRIVCANLTLTVDQSRTLNLGKDAAKTRAMEKSGQHVDLLANHLEGKFAAFFAHGDNGGADYREQAPGISPRPYPDSLRDHMATVSDPEGRANLPRESIMPLVWQCRYSGIHVPDDLAVGEHINAGVNHAQAMDAMARKEEFFKLGSALLTRLVGHIVARRK
jgi:multimeric flavodoxin WrbA